jgi:hypothetical protein
LSFLNWFGGGSVSGLDSGGSGSGAESDTHSFIKGLV